MRFGHPLRYLHRIALRRVKMRGLHRDWWAKRILLALFLTVCVRKGNLHGRMGMGVGNDRGR